MSIRFTRTAGLILATAALAACAGEPAAAPAETEAATVGGVSYEPAYPAEVSEEGLSEADVAQQEGAHNHGEEADHGEAGHTHGDDDADDHDHDH